MGYMVLYGGVALMCICIYSLQYICYTEWSGRWWKADRENAHVSSMLLVT